MKTIISGIKKLNLGLTGFEKGHECLHAFKTIETREFRDENKTLIRTGSTRYLFVANMYPEDEKKHFYYLIYYIPAEARYYKCKGFYDFEYDKIFASGKTIKELLLNFSELLK